MLGDAQAAASGWMELVPNQQQNEAAENGAWLWALKLKVFQTATFGQRARDVRDLWPRPR